MGQIFVLRALEGLMDFETEEMPLDDWFLLTLVRKLDWICANVFLMILYGVG